MAATVCGKCCIYNRRSRGRFYLLYRIGEFDVRRHWRLFVTITHLLQSMKGTYHRQMCIVVLVAHLVLSVLAALVVCVGYIYVLWCLERTYVLAICIVGCLACTWCKRGVALVKFKTFPISYGVTGHICIL